MNDTTSAPLPDGMRMCLVTLAQPPGREKRRFDLARRRFCSPPWADLSSAETRWNMRRAVSRIRHKLVHALDASERWGLE